jgi:hypothetical protein
VSSQRLYLVSLTKEADVTGRVALDPVRQPTVSKRLLADLSEVQPSLRAELRSELEFGAATLGPTLANGSPSLILINDDDFDQRGTGFVLLRLPTGLLRSPSLR